MKKLLALFLVIFAALLVVSGCNDDDNAVASRTKPVPPQGVYTVTGDGSVRVYWNGTYDPDVSEYVVSRSLSSQTGYQEIARVQAEDNPNGDLLIYHYDDNTVTNGVTYWYAVSSVSTNGLESDVSAEEAFDTPRPDGTVTLVPWQIDSTLAGFNFEATARVPYNSILADVFVDIFDGIPYLNAGNEQTFIQDMGFTSTFDEISAAPQDGWSVLGYVELVQGHTYVVWMTNTLSRNHFAKMRVTQLNPSGSIVFQWGYQIDANNPELVAPLQQPVYGPNAFTKQSASGVQR